MLHWRPLNLSSNKIKDIRALSNLNLWSIYPLANLTSLKILVPFGGSSMLNNESKDVHILALKDRKVVVWGGMRNEQLHCKFLICQRIQL